MNDNKKKHGYGRNDSRTDSRRPSGRNNSFRKNSDEKSFRDRDDCDERNSRYDPDEDNGLIVGRNPVIEALKADKPIDTLFVNSEAGGSIGMITRMAREKGIVIKQVSDAKLSSMCRGASHQGCIASGACAEYVSVEDILAVSKKKGTEPFIIICDEIEV